VRFILIAALSLGALAVCVTAAAVVAKPRGLPASVVVAVAAAAVLLAAASGWYGVAVARARLQEPVRPDSLCAMTLALTVLSVVFTSSLHAFYPFRPSVFRRLEGLPWVLPWPMAPHGPLLRFNFAFTAAALVAAAAAAGIYLAGRRRVAVVALSALALVLLVPNDNCVNPFNRPWLRALGASPLMFSANSVALAIAVCGLCQLERATSFGIVATICLATLLLGLGHVTGVAW
jgi:hypothetical protein